MKLIPPFRVAVGNQTVVFEKENDPTVLMSPSTGKLMKFLVNDGEHVNAGDAYAEIEVMKMVTTLHVSKNEWNLNPVVNIFRLN